MQDQGFDKAPDEAGAVVRLCYLDQPADEECYVLSNPVKDSEGSEHILCVATGDSSWLDTEYAHEEYEWSGGATVLVFEKVLVQ